ncbi:MAG: hypothetical protein LBC68_02785, partial [Prevotellaceae bacterium]|nr:hypothetical protein [Prevotellaceae bacterium]
MERDISKFHCLNFFAVNVLHNHSLPLMLSAAENSRFCLEGKGVYGFLTVCQGRAASGFAKKSPHLRCASGSIFFKNLDRPES